MTIPDDVANELISELQRDVPFVSDPWAELGQRVGLTGEQVLSQLQEWDESGVLREISAVLEGSALGYDSALVAGRVPEERLAEVAEIINGHPTITHNYRREHDYNLWFTIAVPVGMGLETTLDILSGLCGGIAFHPLRRTHTFKIGVRFRLDTKTNHTEVVELVPARPITVNDHDQALFRTLQTPLSLEPAPFARQAALAGASEGELLTFASSHLGNAMRRYVGTLRHRKAGVRGNGMTVWNVPEDRIVEAGQLLAAIPEVSHCYARNTIEGFPYTLYGMAHGESDDAVRSRAKEIARHIDCDDYLVLCSTHEFKKCRLRYFLPELDLWWNQHQHLVGAPS